MKDEILKLARENNIHGIVDLINNQPQHPPLYYYYNLVVEFLAEREVKAAYMVTKVFPALYENNGPHCCMALAAGGLMMNNPADALAGRSRLRQSVDRLDPTQQYMFYQIAMENNLPQIAGDAFMRKDYEKIFRILKLYKAGAPVMRSVFDFTQAAPPLDLAKMQQRGRGQLYRFVSPPADAPRPARRALVAMRRLVYAHDPRTRPHDYGPRVNAGFNAYGWQSTFLPLESLDIGLFRSIIDACREIKPDILVLDDEALGVRLPENWGVREEMLQLIRQELPAIKMVSLLLDPWQLPPSFVQQLERIDAIWTYSYGDRKVRNIDESPVAKKLLPSPIPQGVSCVPFQAGQAMRASFTGSVTGFNWHRMFWMTAIDALDLPVEIKLSHHQADNLPALESYGNFLKGLIESGCAMNLSMRPDLSNIITGRVFETIANGALLLQETTPELDRHFIAGEHYLEFSTFAELCAALHFIQDQPEQAEQIRQQGYRFFQEHYTDDKIVGYLEQLLFG